MTNVKRLLVVLMVLVMALSLAACGGKDDELWIYVVDPALEDEVVEYVFTVMDINRKLQKSGVIPAIPRNTSQKVLYSQLPPL